MSRRAKKKVDHKDSNLLRVVGTTRLLEPSLATIDELELDAYVVLLPEDVRPLRGLAGFLDWRLCGRLSHLLLAGSLTGHRGERVLTPAIPGLHAQRVFVFGWGKSDSILENAGERLDEVVETLLAAKVGDLAVDLPYPGRPLLVLVDEHLKKPLGDRLVGVFEPEEA